MSGADEEGGDSGRTESHKGSQDPATRPCAGGGKEGMGRGHGREGAWEGGAWEGAWEGGAWEGGGHWGRVSCLQVGR